jgi:lysophospholipase L1-like esterase
MTHAQHAHTAKPGRRPGRRGLVLALLLAVLPALFLTLASHPGPAAAQEPVRIMPLGDSITGSPGCWRALLWRDLREAGHTNVDFVGSLPAPGCGFEYDGENEGHGGILATNMADQNQLPPWLEAANPDVVMVHLGTNDVWSALPADAILDAFTTLVGQMRANNPDVTVLVAQIIPMNPDNCAECGQRAEALNEAIPAWAEGLSTARSPITVVDQWTGFDTATDTYDGVHPNEAGDRKIADGWYPALTEAISAGS